jgi:hypothetical protein
MIVLLSDALNHNQIGELARAGIEAKYKRVRGTI